MKILFTTNNKIGSRFIRWGTSGDCSHVALVFDENENGESDGIVFHSTGLKGSHPIWLHEFLKQSKIVHAIGMKPEISESVENQIFKTIVTDYAGQGYDDRAFLFWVIMGIRRKILGIPLPQKNDWAVAGYNLCTALIGPIQKQFPDRFLNTNIDWEMISPFHAFIYLREQPGFFDAHQWVKTIQP